jgi:hypothetical protein
MKGYLLVLVMSGLLAACGGSDEELERAAKAARDKETPKQCENGLSLSGDLCVSKPAGNSTAAETM